MGKFLVFWVVGEFGTGGIVNGDGAGLCPGEAQVGVLEVLLM